MAFEKKLNSSNLFPISTKDPLARYDIKQILSHPFYSLKHNENDAKNMDEISQNRQPLQNKKNIQPTKQNEVPPRENFTSIKKGQTRYCDDYEAEQHSRSHTPYQNEKHLRGIIHNKNLSEVENNVKSQKKEREYQNKENYPENNEEIQTFSPFIAKKVKIK